MNALARRGLLGLALLAGCAVATAFPTKPITIVVPAPPGGTADTVVRTLIPRLTAAPSPPRPWPRRHRTATPC